MLCCLITPHCAHNDSLSHILQDEKLMEEATVREVMNRIQRLRKKAEVKPTDSINIYFKADKALTGVITRNLEEIVATIGMPVIDDQNTRDGKVCIL